MIQIAYNDQKIIHKFNISARSVRNIKSQGDQLSERSNDVALSTNRKSFRQEKYETIDKKVLPFFELFRTANLLATLHVIIQRAIIEQEDILKNKDAGEAAKDCMRQFSASKCRAVNFVRRHTFKSVSVHGQGESVNISYAAHDISQLGRQLGEYEPENIYKVDEIGSFFKLLPRRTYIFPTEYRRNFAWNEEDVS